ncbi:MAG: hypothetical protein ACI4IW_00385 [Oscillospiraceae bacterium]
MKDGTYSYAIEMTAPLGKRKGLLEIVVRNELVNGFLTMFTNTAPIAKGLLSGRHISFSGDMKTLMDTFSYLAEGTVTSSGLDLVFRTEHGTYPAVGRPAIPDTRRIKTL